MAQATGKLSASDNALRWDPIDVLDNEHADHHRLCDELETVADGLPDEIDPNLCASIIKTLRFDVPVHHRDEEDVLFPMLASRALPEDGIADILQQLNLEHAADESFATELIDHLELMAAGGRPDNPNMVGYMLRGFFEGYRRHLVWEQSVILPLARRRLSHEDMKQLADRMIERRLSGNREAESKDCNGDCGACNPDKPGR